MIKRINYGWVIAGASFFITAMNAMALFGFGVFLKPLTEEFGWNRGDLSSVFSIAVLIGGILSLAVGRLGDRFSPRILITAGGISLGIAFLATSFTSELWQLYLAYALPTGIAIACTVIPINSTIPRWLTRGKGMALAMPAMGFSTGGVIAPLLIEWLIGTVGWQQAFLALGILPFVITVPLAWIFKIPQENPGAPGDTTEPKADSDDIPARRSGKLSIKEVLKNRWFWAYACLQFSFGFSTQMIIVHIAPYGTDTGLSPVVAAGILSFSSLAGIAGNLSAGFLSDKMNARLLQIFSFILLTVALGELLLAGNTFLFYLFAFLFGIARGAIALLMTITAIETFGVKHFGFYMGAFMLAGTIGGVVGTPIAGYIFDASGSYGAAFWMAIIAGILAVIMSFLVFRHRFLKI